jgi:hypothetical protein
MIDLGNIGGLHAHNHELHAHCPRCGRWATLPLAEWVSQGKGSLRLPISVRCASNPSRSVDARQLSVPNAEGGQAFS